MYTDLSCYTLNQQNSNAMFAIFHEDLRILNPGVENSTLFWIFLKPFP